MADKLSTQVNDSGAAVVCIHVAKGQRPILRAERDEPVSPEDSGWQFLCGAGNHKEEEAQVWAVSEILSKDETLADYIDLPAGTLLVRATAGSRWSDATGRN
ncbi:DUF2185 domain-containing protein [Haliangium sp. UPWRP_2]|uniref:immunity protein Imm33 domain-containing protein n=1 Tax=Haliangium sp. UPWRP_2 TaxID=1931276 RepID=UPI000B539F47|nr:DUF2185 domain-containing protein [Haliangium sp. UPWRP_2]PSM30816.1 DUF2185 domain-containing protein [Haliangium sp. UPWRP_2]